MTMTIRMMRTFLRECKRKGTRCYELRDALDIVGKSSFFFVARRTIWPNRLGIAREKNAKLNNVCKRKLTDDKESMQERGECGQSMPRNHELLPKLPSVRYHSDKRTAESHPPQDGV